MPKSWAEGANYEQTRKYRKACAPLVDAARKRRASKAAAIQRAIATAKPFASPQSKGTRALERQRQLTRIAMRKAAKKSRVLAKEQSND